MFKKIFGFLKSALEAIIPVLGFIGKVKYKKQAEVLVSTIETFSKAEGNEEKGKILKEAIKVAAKETGIDKKLHKTVKRIEKKVLEKLFGK